MVAFNTSYLHLSQGVICICVSHLCKKYCNFPKSSITIPGISFQFKRIWSYHIYNLFCIELVFRALIFKLYCPLTQRSEGYLVLLLNFYMGYGIVGNMWLCSYKHGCLLWRSLSNGCTVNQTCLGGHIRRELSHWELEGWYSCWVCFNMFNIKTSI